MKKNIRNRIFAIALLLASNSVILLVAAVLRQTVVDSWKKGPLIDPAAPYSPENAQWFFAVGMCAVLNLYFLLLATVPKFRSARWFPFFALFLSIGITELGISQYLSHYQTTYFRPHPTLHWSCQANLRNFNNHTGGGKLNTNEFGMREVTEPQEKPDNQFRILVLGDSSNFGHGVEGNEMWASQLQDILDPLTPRDVRVLNGSCPGWTTWQGLEVVRTYGGEYEPDLIIAGFNNDSGPDFQTDRERVSSSETVRFINSIMFRSELYILSREAILSIIRKLNARSQQAYQTRLAGEKSNYGKLKEQEKIQLVQRVPLTEMQDNIRQLKRLATEKNGDFVWINMPVNRREGEFVERYVDWEYRETIDNMSTAEDINLIDVDNYWLRSREDGLHIHGHVFHPNAQGHRRMAEQIAADLVQKKLIPEASGTVKIASPTLAKDTEILRFGFSENTPLHYQLGLALQEHPQLAEKHGLTLAFHSYQSGKTQGKDVAEHQLDAWFSCAVPAIHMLNSRPDAKIIASVGSLGKIAIISQPEITNISQLQGKKIGLSKGSTPEMYWRYYWSQQLRDVEIVNLKTAEMKEALLTGSVDAIVSWDPWISEWQIENPAWNIVREKEFHSVLNVGTMWALGENYQKGKPTRARRFVNLMRDALKIVVDNQDYYIEKAAEKGEWSILTVEKVVGLNEAHQMSLNIQPQLQREIRDSLRFVDPNHKRQIPIFGEYLLQRDRAPNSPNMKLKPSKPAQPKHPSRNGRSNQQPN